MKSRIFRFTLIFRITVLECCNLQFSERIFDAWRSKQIEEDLSPVLNQLSLANVIKSCARNETLYHIFAMDKKYHLYDLRQYGKELYDRLELSIQDAFAEINLSKSIGTFASPEQLEMLLRVVNVTIESNIPQISLQVLSLLLLLRFYIIG